MPYKNPEDEKNRQKLYYDAHRTELISKSRRYAKHRVALVQQLKIDRGCRLCGYCRCADALDFHHRDGEEKHLNIAIMKKYYGSMAALWAEIAKCDIVCANCHREIHAGLARLPDDPLPMPQLPPRRLNQRHRHDIDTARDILPLLEQGYSPRAIAFRLKTSHSTIDRRVQQAQRDGLIAPRALYRRPDIDTVRDIMPLHNQGYTCADLAKHFGMAKQSIEYRLKLARIASLL
jgi:hypothetical protein